MRNISNLFPKKSFLRNFSVLLSTNLLVSAIAMVVSIYVARVLSPENYGRYAVIITIISIFNVISSLGLSATVTREIARNQNISKIIFKSASKAYYFGFFISSILVSFYLFLFEKDIDIELLFLIIISLFAQSRWVLFESSSFGMKRMEQSGLINLMLTSFLLLIYMILPKKLIELKLVVFILVLSQLIKSVIYYAWIKKNGILRNTFESGSHYESYSSINLIKISFPFLVMGVFSMFSNQIPILFLNENSGPEEVAYYNTANKLLMPITLFITTAMTALFPDLSIFYEREKEKFKTTIKNGLSLISFFGVIGAIFISVFKDEIVLILYGEAYKNTGFVMAYQCWFIILFAYFCFFGSVLSASNKQKLLSYLSIFYAIVSVPILWIGSKEGAEYLSLAFILAGLINMTYHLYFVQKILPSPFSTRFLIKLFAIIFIPFGLSFTLPANLSLLEKSLIILVSYIILFVTLRDTILSVYRKFKQKSNND